MPSRFLVTGVAGFIGSNLAQRLLGQGHTVLGVDNFNDYYDPTRKRANVATFGDHERFTLHEIDLRDRDAVEAVVAQLPEHELDTPTHAGGEGNTDGNTQGNTEENTSHAAPPAIAHLGAYGGVRYSIGRAHLYNNVNVTGSINLLEAARIHGINQFVFASTSSVYGHTDQLPFVETDPCNRPLAPYPASKKAIEVMGHSYVNLHDLNFTALRFFSVYGPRGRPDMMPFMVMDRIVKGQTIQLYDAGDMKRDWTYVDDIVSGIVAALRTPLGYEIMNLGRGEPVVMRDFVTIIEELVGEKAKLETPPAPASEPKITFARIDKARRLLDYQPQTPVREGLANTWDWYQRVVMS